MNANSQKSSKKIRYKYVMKSKFGQFICGLTCHSGSPDGRDVWNCKYCGKIVYKNR